MLQKEFNFRSLMVKDENGVYRHASSEEIIEAAMDEMKRRFSRGAEIASPEATKKFLQLKLGRLEHEVFAVLWLDNRHRVIAFDELFRGTIDGASVHPREVVKTALGHNAAACIFAHNHPFGRRRAEPGRPAHHPKAARGPRPGGGEDPGSRDRGREHLLLCGAGVDVDALPMITAPEDRPATESDIVFQIVR